MLRKLFRSTLFLGVSICFVSLFIFMNPPETDAFQYARTTFDTYFIYDIHDGTPTRFGYKVVEAPNQSFSDPGFLLRDWIIFNYYENGQYIETVYTEERQAWIFFPKIGGIVIGEAPGTFVRDTQRRYDYLWTDPATRIFTW